MNPDFFKQYRIIPILNPHTADDLKRSIDLLLLLNHRIVEIVIRNRNSLHLIEILKKEYPDLTVGGGTVLNTDTYQKLIDLKADFIVSPGFTDELLSYSRQFDTPYIPGAYTPSEIMHLISRDFHLIKIFPVKALGGVRFMKTIESVFHHRNIHFIPTGGIANEEIPDYLELSSVRACSTSALIHQDMTQDELNHVSDIIRKIQTIKRHHD